MLGRVERRTLEIERRLTMAKDLILALCFALEFQKAIDGRKERSAGKVSEMSSSTLWQEANLKGVGALLWRGPVSKSNTLGMHDSVRTRS